MKAYIFPVLAIALVAGCIGQAGDAGPAPEPGEEPQTREFGLTIFHTRYDPAQFTVNKGDTVRIVARTASGTGEEGGFSHIHGVTIDEYLVNEAVVFEEKDTVIEFTADQGGTFTIYCMTCWDGPFGRGHPAIQAVLTVQE